MSLGDFFPENIRKQYSDRSISVGTVFRLHVPNTKPPKIKYFVVIGLTEDTVSFGTVFINSTINPNVNYTPYLKSLNISISASDYEFLTHNSFVDCSRIYEKNKQDFISKTTQDPEVVKGKLSDADMQRVMDTLRSATTITNKTKSKYQITTT